jgi:hypothetical protein
MNEIMDLLASFDALFPRPSKKTYPMIKIIMPSYRLKVSSPMPQRTLRLKKKTRRIIT